MIITSGIPKTVNRVFQPTRFFGIKLLILTLLSLIFFLFAPTAQACTVYTFNSSKNEYQGLESDCANPFFLDNEGWDLPHAVFLNDQILEADSEIFLDTNTSYFFVTDPDFFQWRYFRLFHHRGDDFYEVATDDLDRYVFTPGVYTLLIDQRVVVNYRHPYWNWLKNAIIPTAHADWGNMLYGVTFVVREEKEVGGSNILFIPGIQGSYLYEGVQGKEFERWLPFGNTDVRQLMMDETGQSLNNIYTKTNDVLRKAYSVVDIYDTFINKLDTYKNTEKFINDFGIYAYDWRYDVSSIVKNGTQYQNETKYLVDEIERLAASSKTGKVTIVGHSNGGLLGKALFAEYGESLKSKVDNFIMVGTPQYGASETLAKLLHGYESNWLKNLLSSRSVNREAVRNFPVAYSLLPSQKYFATYQFPALIKTDGSELTNSYVGNTAIDNRTILEAFLNNTSRPSPSESVSLNRPTNVNIGLLNQAGPDQVLLEDFIFPDEVEVYEIAGRDLPTLSGLYYTRLPCNPLVALLICSDSNGDLAALKVIPYFDVWGDGTVAVKSATGYLGSKNSFTVDLAPDEVNHSSMMSSDGVIEILDHLFKGDSELPTVPLVLKQPQLLLGAHSPVEIIVTDEEGRTAGISEGNILEDIPGSRYLELGESKYLLIPDNGNYEVALQGTDDGYYALTAHTLNDGFQELVNILGYTPVSSNTQAFLSYSSTEQFSDIATDFDGDSIIDEVYSWNDLSVMSDLLEEPTSRNSGGGYLPLVAESDLESDNLIELYKQLFELLLQLKLLLEARLI